MNNSNMTNVAPIKFWFEPIIPLVYSNELSYYEQLAKILEKLNEVIEVVNNWSDSVLKEANSYTDSQVEAMKVYIDMQDNTIQNSITQLDAKLQRQMAELQSEYQNANAELREWVNEQILSVLNQFSDFINTVDDSLASLKQLIYSQDALIYTKLDSEVKRLEDLIEQIQINPVQKLINPVNNEVEDIQTVTDTMFYNLKAWALRARNYDRLELTANEYDSFTLGAWNYDYMAKWYLREKPEVMKDRWSQLIYNRTVMHSPFTGEIDSIVDILGGILNIIRYDGITAEEYDGLELSANEYDALGWTAYYYDWFGILLMPIGDRGLEAEQYDNLQVLSHRVMSYPDTQFIKRRN